MLFRQLTGHKQTKAGAVPLRREVRFEDALRIRGSDATAVVANLYADNAIQGLGADGNLSAVLRCVDGVQDKVEEDLHELVADTDQRRQIGRNLRRDAPALRALVILGDVQGFFHDVAERNAIAAGAGGTAEVNELAQRYLNALQLAADEAEFLARVVIIFAALQHLHERTDRRERIADFVRDPRRQKPEC